MIQPRRWCAYEYVGITYERHYIISSIKIQNKNRYRKKYHLSIQNINFFYLHKHEFLWSAPRYYICSKCFNNGPKTLLFHIIYKLRSNLAGRNILTTDYQWKNLKVPPSLSLFWRILFYYERPSLQHSLQMHTMYFILHSICHAKWSSVITRNGK